MLIPTVGLSIPQLIVLWTVIIVVGVAAAVVVSLWLDRHP